MNTIFRIQGGWPPRKATVEIHSSNSGRWLAVAIAVLVVALSQLICASSAYARDALTTKLIKPPASWAHCFLSTGHKYGINPYLLAGISRFESQDNPRATSPSPAFGLLQIDHSWLSTLERMSIRKDDLFVPCTNIDVGAWILAHELKKHGDTWEAVGALNAACTRLKGAQCRSQRAWYAWHVYKVMKTLTPQDIGLQQQTVAMADTVDRP